ncbi:hypothetical protein TASIC1_0008035700 [Trichoderma asperellum]|uniref:F-box domain-containing protein n=1 Tax=Trichoderma asperellum TaxID=101201 RepID=A0A6V8R0C2_TRIAP|nr:hypothetical protein TASIC1_0008035700 [Trichoderma asperellum]
MTAAAAALSLAALRLHDPPRLQDLPPAIWAIIFSLLDSAQTVARIALTCKKLNAVAQAQGWPCFVRSRFVSLKLPKALGDNEWVELASKLTAQSRAWDRRAFSITMQTFPAHVVVDASSKVDGQKEEETVAWGLGEDIVFRWRKSHNSVLQGETWISLPGVEAGFKSGDDDVTAISVLRDTAPQAGLLVGRASGYLQLISTGRGDVGRLLAWFHPMRGGVDQHDIQHFGIDESQNAMVVATKENVLFYSLVPNSWPAADMANGTPDIVVEPTEAINVKRMPNSQEFRFLREAKYMSNGDIALCMASSAQPLRYLTRTPSGTVLANAAKLRPSKRCVESHIFNGNAPQTARSVLPVNTSSAVGGSGNTVLSSYDDGTVRLQDLRSHSPIDAIFQDHFEMTAPLGPLLSYGTDRFIVGSARLPILKIFDFRWTRPYSYTDALDCSKTELGPTPKTLTGIPAPRSSAYAKCCHLSRHQCALHSLARTDFYRPNCNLYLPVVYPAVTPLYSLAKSSDMASTIYAGVTGELLKISLRDAAADEREDFCMERMGSNNRCGYSFRRSLANLVETGDGIALSDISKSKRLPLLFKQNPELLSAAATGELRRLDHALC